MISLGFGFGAQLSPRNLRDGIGVPQAARDRMSNLAPWGEKLPDIMRFGAGSVSEQIQTRTFMGRSGGHAWEEPSYAQGKRPPAVVASEDIMWSAAMGTGPGAITTPLPNGASIAVDDNVVRLLAARLPTANRVVSTAAYFPFVTGGWERRQTPGKAMPAKPMVPFRGQRAAKGQGKPHPKPKNITSWSSRQAMYWFLLLNFDYDATEAELRGGIDVPPKNIGISVAMLERARKALAEHLVPGKAAA